MTTEGRWWSCGKKGKAPVYFRVPENEYHIEYARQAIVLAMKPCDGTFAENAVTHGVAGLNIDGTRIGTENRTVTRGGVNSTVNAYGKYAERSTVENYVGRWPTNLILDEQVATMLPDAPGQMADISTNQDSSRNKICYGALKRSSKEASADRRYTDNGSTNFAALPGARRLDGGSASRFFYTAKADSAERGTGNNHPTVKPLDLMRYLSKLLCPPGKASLIEPFMGSGSTILAARGFFRRVVGIEIDEHYCEIAAKRLSQGMLDLQA